MESINVASNLAAVTKRIQTAAYQAQREPSSVALLAVSKTKTLALIAEAVAAGQRRFGENYAQEAAEKSQDAASFEPRVAFSWPCPVQQNAAISHLYGLDPYH